MQNKKNQRTQINSLVHKFVEKSIWRQAVNAWKGKAKFESWLNRDELIIR